MTFDELQPQPQQLILVSQLTVDLQNPRLPEVQPNAREALRAMARTQGEKILALAEHIVKNGLNPATMPIVMPSEEDDAEDMYTVLDGNRRISTLKLLESPAIAEGALAAKLFQRLKRIAREYETKAIAEIQCVVVPDRQAADPWIQLTHRGQNQGAGLVEWDGQVAARYDSRNGERSFALQVLDYVRMYGTLSPLTKQRIDDGKYPLTNLRRLIGTPYVRDRLGISIVNGELWILYPEEEILKGLTRMVEDFGRGDPDFTVSRIKNQTQRVIYINEYGVDELPAANTIFSAPRPIGKPGQSTTGGGGPASGGATGGAGSGGPASGGATGGAGSGGPASGGATGGAGSPGANTSKGGKVYDSRSTLIPKNCRLSITHRRIRGIYKELQTLDINQYSNACSVMLRVFLELSLDHYLEEKLSWPEQQIENTKLSFKLDTVASYFERSGLMTAAQLTPIKKASGGQTLLAASVKTMHAYVHSRYSSAIASELKVAWDDLQPFIERIWS